MSKYLYLQFSFSYHPYTYFFSREAKLLLIVNVMGPLACSHFYYKFPGWPQSSYLTGDSENMILNELLLGILFPLCFWRHNYQFPCELFWDHNLSGIKVLQKQCVHLQNPPGWWRALWEMAAEAQTELKSIHKFFIFSISEAYSSIFSSSPLLHSIYKFKGLLPLKWNCFWASSLATPWERDFCNLISIIWDISGKSEHRIWLYRAAFIFIHMQMSFLFCSPLPHLLLTFLTLQ